jgi:cephalosporin hydroxylase
MYKQFKEECDKEIEVQNNPDVLKKLHSFYFDEHLKKYSYHFEWLGRPIIQLPQDIVQFQELVWQVKPDLIIETGIAHGGSLILSASMLALLDYSPPPPPSSSRVVLGIDIDIRKPNREAIEAHPLSSKIKMIEGSSISEDIARQVREFAREFKTIMICLDSNHTHEHVLQELNLYADLVSVGSYCIVFDTLIEDDPTPDATFADRPWGKGNNPKTAVWEFLKDNDDFIIDTHIQNKLLLTAAPDGYLKRIK